VLADCAASAGKHTLAVRTAERAVMLNPHSWATHYTLGHALLDAPGLYYSGASAAIDAAERLAPASADVHNLRGMYLSNIGNRRGARAAYGRALALDPHSSVALNNLATLDVRRRPGRSARLLTSAASLDPQRLLIQENLSVVTWNILVYFYRALLWSGFVVAISRGFGVALWFRLAILACVAAAIVFWALRRLRHLPRGYRHAPSQVWASFSRTQRIATAGLVAQLVLMGVVGFGPVSAVGIAWLAMIGLGLLMRVLTSSK
jgi:tetratricopeptide (TPR) repeat protein